MQSNDFQENKTIFKLLTWIAEIAVAQYDKCSFLKQCDHIKRLSDSNAPETNNKNIFIFNNKINAGYLEAKVKQQFNIYFLNHKAIPFFLQHYETKWKTRDWEIK